MAVRIQDGSGNNLTSTNNALDVNLKTSSVGTIGAVFITDGLHDMGSMSYWGNQPSVSPEPYALNVNAAAWVQNTVTITGTVTIQSNASVNLAQLNGVALGSPTDWGTAPATSVEVIGVNAEMFAGSTALTAQSGGQLNVALYTGTTAISNTTAGIPDVNIKNIGNAATKTTGTAGELLVGIVGSTGSTLDATLAAGTSPTNGLGIVAQYNTTVPAPTAAQTVGLQCAPNGSLLTQPFRRSQIKMATGSIASTTAATLLAAQGAGIFADLKSLVLTLSAETTAAYITVNISDGTNTYEFGFSSEAVGTAGSGAWPVPINWDVPIPATTANTAWTIALSAADATVRYVAQFINQTANF